MPAPDPYPFVRMGKRVPHILPFDLMRRAKTQPLHFNFFVIGVLPAPLAKLLVLDFPLHQLLVPVGMVIPPFARGASQCD